MTNNLPIQSGQATRFWDQSILFVSKAVNVEVHRHRCFQVVISLTSTFDCAIEGQKLIGLKGLIVNQNIPHACRVPAGDVLVIFIESDSYWGVQLRALLTGQPYLNLADLIEFAEINSVLPAGYETMPNAALIPYIDLFFERIVPPTFNQATMEMDERIVLALQYIEQHFPKRLSVEEVADHICLSPVRTRHLFADETGAPLSQYVLWKRIKTVLKVTSNRESTLADACIDFGFVDQPHFNRIFKQIFGTVPNAMIKGGRIIG